LKDELEIEDEAEADLALCHEIERVVANFNKKQNGTIVNFVSKIKQQKIGMT